MKINFEAMDWEKVDTGGMRGRMKKWTDDKKRVRLMEFSPKWNEVNWCTLGHSAYILKGTLSLKFKADNAEIKVRKGEAFHIPPGMEHKATCKKTTLAFMVDELQKTA
jgi:quercetin dioxygenase-like cupin family protein